MERLLMAERLVMTVMVFLLLFIGLCFFEGLMAMMFLQLLDLERDQLRFGLAVDRVLKSFSFGFPSSGYAKGDNCSTKNSGFDEAALGIHE